MGFGMGLIWSGRAYGHKKSPGKPDPGGEGPSWVPYPVAPPARPYFFRFFSGPGLAQAVLTWSRPWNGTGERNASTASTTAVTRACGMVRKERGALEYASRGGGS
jgi:hypothetical protein